MAQVAANGIQLEVETTGERGARPLVLIRGLGTQLIQWAPGLREQLAKAGHFVVVFDNRDVGLSTHFPEAGTAASYTLDDMADDVTGLLDVLGLASAHIAGISMGGLIAQLCATRHPERVRSLTSIMSGTGNPDVPGPSKQALAMLLAPTPRERSAYIEHTVAGARVFGSPGFPFDLAGQRELAARVYDRAFDPDGVARQFAAIQAAGDRRPELARLTVPTLVVHGKGDCLVPLEAGIDTAKAIPGAELRLVEGMGHDLPPGVWPELVPALAAHTTRAEAVRQG